MGMWIVAHNFRKLAGVIASRLSWIAHGMKLGDRSYKGKYASSQNNHLQIPHSHICAYFLGFDDLIMIGQLRVISLAKSIHTSSFRFRASSLRFGSSAGIQSIEPKKKKKEEVNKHMRSPDETSISLTFEVVLSRFICSPSCMAAANSWSILIVVIVKFDQA